jgi:hypothetical protein
MTMHCKRSFFNFLELQQLGYPRWKMIKITILCLAPLSDFGRYA